LKEKVECRREKYFYLLTEGQRSSKILFGAWVMVLNISNHGDAPEQQKVDNAARRMTQPYFSSRCEAEKRRVNIAH
jgi:hypothetical protein